MRTNTMIGTLQVLINFVVARDAGPAGTGTSYIIHLLINSLKSDNSIYLLLAPTDVAVIHSALKIIPTQST